MGQNKHILQAAPVDASRNSRTIAGGRLLRPSTHIQAKYHQPHRSEQLDIRAAVIQERALFDVHRRIPQEESTGRTTGDQTLLEGEANGMTRTERRQREKEREETGKLQGTRNPGESGRGVEGERGGPDPSSDWKKWQTKFKGLSLEINQADVRGMEQHRPIMDKLEGLGGRTYRQINIQLMVSVTLRGNFR